MDRTFLEGRPSEGLAGPILDLATFARELLRPTLLTPAGAEAMREVAFPGISGVVPGIGRFDPCDWGLGVEIHDGKRLHWMGANNSPATVGHFGGAGTFLWVDPAVDRALVVLTDRGFGAWALAPGRPSPTRCWQRSASPAAPGPFASRIGPFASHGT